MKKILLTLSLLLVGFTTAHAQLASASLNGNDELFLGFTASGGSGSATNIVVDLGAYSSFLNLGSGSLTPSKFSTLIGNLSGAISNVYGTNWRSNANLSWAIMGAVNPATNGDTLKTLFASTQTGNSALLRQSASTQQGQVQTVLGEGIQYVTDYGQNQFTTGGTGSTGSVTNEAVYFVPANEGTTWASGVTALDNAFSATIETGVTNSLDLYKLQAATGGAVNTAGTDLGTFSLAAVPEPSTWALMLIGGVILMLGISKRKII